MRSGATIDSLKPYGMREYRADASLLFISLIWGSTFIIVKQAIETIPTFAFLTLRFSVAFAILCLLCIRRVDRLTTGTIRDGLLLGTALFLAFAFQTLGLKYTSASVTGFITGLYVVLVPILSALCLKKNPHWLSMVGVSIACVGLGLITLNTEITLSMGLAFVLVNALFCAVHIVMTDALSRHHDPFLLTTVQIGTIWALSGAISIPLEPFTLPREWTVDLVVALLLTGVLATVLAFLVQMGMQKHTTPTKAAIIFCMEPVSSAFFGYLIGGEILSLRQYCGALLIVFAMVAAESGTLLRGKGGRI